MASLLYIPQYKQTVLNVPGGITSGQTTGIIAGNTDGVDITKPGLVCITYADPVDTAVAEYFTYTSIDGNKEFQGVTRAQEGISAKAHLNNASIAFVYSKAHINRINDKLTGVDTTVITDTSGNEILVVAEVSSAVNYISLKNSATGNGPEVKALGDNTNIDLVLVPKGTGDVAVYVPTGNDATIKATGADTDVNLKLTGKGAGLVQFSPDGGSTWQDLGAGGASFWSDVEGTPTRVSDTQFTITDTSNADKLDLLFKKGVIIKWLESTTVNVGMVVSSSYGANTVTINIVGDSLTAGFTDMKYCLQMSQIETFIIPGTLATGTDLAKTWYTPQGEIVLSADGYVKTAGTTNATTFDINDDGTTMFGDTAVSIASAGTSDIDNVKTTPTTEVVAGSLVTVDITGVSTTAPIEAYIYLYYFPTSWLYRT